MTKAATNAQDIELAKEALGRKDYDTARKILEPLVARSAKGLANFYLARLEIEQGNFEAADPWLTEFQNLRPEHPGANALRARLEYGLGEMDAAKSAAQAALDVRPDFPAMTRILEQIAAAEIATTAKAHIKVLDDGYLAARESGPSAELRDAAKALADLTPGPDWTSETVQATIAYFRNATDLDAAIRNYDPHLIDVSTRFDYITWPKRIQEHVLGRSVIDVGCGFGGYGMGFLVAGATSYAGLDPAMRLDSTRAKNKRTRSWSDMGVTPRSVAEALPNIRLFECTAEEMPVKETFDTISLHNVTEHLMQLDLVFGGLVDLCHDDTEIVFLHHNFYCWNGHHLAPVWPHQLDENDPKQQAVYDWRHIDFLNDIPEGHLFATSLNRVRLDEIKDITEKHFKVVEWNEIQSSKDTLARFTPEILKRVRKTIPDLTERELKTHVVFCVAKKK